MKHRLLSVYSIAQDSGTDQVSECMRTSDRTVVQGTVYLLEIIDILYHIKMYETGGSMEKNGSNNRN